MDALTEQAVEVDARGGDVDLSEAMAQLSPKDAEVLRLTYWEELSAAEVAEVLGSSEQATWKRISRAKQSLRRVLTATHGTVGKEDAHV